MNDRVCSGEQLDSWRVFFQERKQLYQCSRDKNIHLRDSRIHHHNICLAGNNFSDCYDRAAHPMAAISLQCFGIPQPAIYLLLETMETMRFFLHTGFGESKTLMEGPMNSNFLDTDKEMQLQVLVSQL